MVYERPDPIKLRNATLLIGVILLAISAAQIEIDLTESVTFLGLPLIIAERDLLTFALVAVSGYYLFRYWYYSMRSRTTWAVRKTISKILEIDTTDNTKSTTKTASNVGVESVYEMLDHSGLKYDSASSTKHVDASRPSQTYWIVEVKNLQKYSAATFLRDLDFAAPALVNIAALGYALRNIVV